MSYCPILDRCGVLHLPLPALDLPGWSQQGQRVWHQRSGPDAEQYGSGGCCSCRSCGHHGQTKGGEEKRLSKTFICLPGPSLLRARGLVKLRQGGKLLFSCYGHHFKKRKEKNAVQLFWFLCGTTENHIQCRLGKFFFLFHALSFCSSSEVKQTVMYCILYDFSEGNNVLELRFGGKCVTVPHRHIYFFFIQGQKEAKCNFCSLCRFLVNFSFHSMCACHVSGCLETGE